MKAAHRQLVTAAVYTAQSTVQVLWNDVVRLTLCKAAGHSWRRIPLGYHGTALSCRACKDFRVVPPR